MLAIRNNRIAIVTMMAACNFPTAGWLSFWVACFRGTPRKHAGETKQPHRHCDYDGRMQFPDGRIRRLRRSSDDATAAHALTFSCFHRRPFLKSERTCLWLVEAMERARRDHPFDLWAYVFMPEHVHIVLWPTTPSFRLGVVLAAIKLPVSRRAIAFVRQYAPDFKVNMRDAQPNGRVSLRFWQRGGGYDRDLHDAGTIHATIDYVHANPVRAKLIERPEQWRWSSAAYFAGTGAVPLEPDAHSIPTPPARWRFRTGS
ncbi:MAG: hypothetical protein IPM64_11500 [Phycisphaerales bacterium]|nr:hypothetical protein [Phycisphaerales bacterium]